MKSVWIFIIGMLLLPLVGIGEVRIEDVRATPVAPWGRIVVDYTVAGTLPTDAVDYVAVVTASNRMTGTVYASVVTGGETALAVGKHRIWWNAGTAGLREAAEAIDVRVSYISSSFLCIDLSEGPNAVTYPTFYLPKVPSEGEYRTTKLVLRRIEPGSFIMGDDQTDESHRVTLTKPFYMGVFEVTQKQWERVMGSSSLFSDSIPTRASYGNIRGFSTGSWGPASSAVDESSFLGRLRARTGLEFDLPTEAQWEYACRAGTTTTYYWGDAMDDAYAWYKDNSNRTTHSVGWRLPNAWGLYDMSGNVWEWCRDWYGTLAYGSDPVGSASGSYRVVIRGGSRDSSAVDCTSSYRGRGNPFYQDGGIGYDLYGFRLVWVLSD